MTPKVAERGDAFLEALVIGLESAEQPLLAFVLAADECVSAKRPFGVTDARLQLASCQRGASATSTCAIRTGMS